MHPIIFQLGGISLHSYGLMAALGFITALIILNCHRKYADLTSDQVTNITIIGMVAGVIGARIFYFAQFYDEQFRGEWWKIFYIHRGGLVFYGGFILAIVALVIYCKWRKLDIIRVLDISTPAIAAAHACGRVGCFLNGCCYGGATALPWGVCFPAGSPADLAEHGAAVHPVQLYEAGEMVLCSIFFAFLVRRTGRGVAMSSYLIVYGILRFLNEFARGDNPHWLGLFTPAQWIGLGMVPIGAAMLIWFVRHERKEA